VIFVQQKGDAVSRLSEQQQQYLADQANDFIVHFFQVTPKTAAHQKLQQYVRQIGDQELSLIQSHNHRFMTSMLGHMQGHHQHIVEQVQIILKMINTPHAHHYLVANQQAHWVNQVEQLAQAFGQLTWSYDQLLRENLQLQQESVRLQDCLDQQLASLQYLLEQLIMLMPPAESVELSELLEKKHQQLCVYAISLVQQMEALTLKYESNQALMYQIEQIQRLQKFRAQSQCVVGMLQQDTFRISDIQLQQLHGYVQEISAQLSTQQQILSRFQK
jgi:hypothetical protein